MKVNKAHVAQVVASVIYLLSAFAGWFGEPLISSHPLRFFVGVLPVAAAATFQYAAAWVRPTPAWVSGIVPRIRQITIASTVVAVVALSWPPSKPGVNGYDFDGYGGYSSADSWSSLSGGYLVAVAAVSVLAALVASDRLNSSHQV